MVTTDSRPGFNLERQVPLEGLPGTLAEVKTWLIDTYELGPTARIRHV